MSTIAIIQARLGSTRLPGKALMAIQGKPIIGHVVERAMAMRQVDAVVLALSGDSGDLALWDWGSCVRHLGVRRVIDIPSNDVLGRFAAVLDSYPDVDTVVRLTGDCPLLAPEIGDAVVALLRCDGHAEFASNIAPGYVDGTDVEVFSAAALRWAHREAHDPRDREHVAPWIRRHVKSLTLPPAGDYSAHKWSVDTQADLDRVRAIAARLPAGDFRFQTTLAAAAADRFVEVGL